MLAVESQAMVRAEPVPVVHGEDMSPLPPALLTSTSNTRPPQRRRVLGRTLSSVLRDGAGVLSASIGQHADHADRSDCKRPRRPGVRLAKGRAANRYLHPQHLLGVSILVYDAILSLEVMATTRER